MSPTGQTLLFDTGTGGDNNRDADRITNLLRQVAVEPQLDHVIVSHYHGDHVGNAAELSKRLPIRHFYDHGGYTVEGQPNRRAAFDSYLAVRATAHVDGAETRQQDSHHRLRLYIVSNAGELVTSPVAGMPGAGAPNPLCREFVPRVQDATPENAEAIGAVVRYGNFTLLDPSDLIGTWRRSSCVRTTCSVAADVYLTSRHGTDWAGNPVMVHAVRPRVAVMNNSPRKGGTARHVPRFSGAPGSSDCGRFITRRT